MNACCIICSDRFLSGENDLNIAAGKCGHTFHSSCLDTWLATSSTCPKCRQKWSKKEVIRKLYFEYDSTTIENDGESRLLNDLNSFRARVVQADLKVKTLTNELNECVETKQGLSSCYEEVCQQLKTMVVEKKDLQTQLQFYQSCEQSWRHTEKECFKLKDLLHHYRQIERLVKDSETDSKELLRTITPGSGALDRLANMCSIIKREYVQCKRSKKLQRLELDQTRKDLASLRVQMGEIQTQNDMLKEQSQRMEEQLNEAEKREESLRAKAAKRHSYDHSEIVSSTSKAHNENVGSSDCLSLSSCAGHSNGLPSINNSQSKRPFITDDDDSENSKQPMNFRLTSAASKKPRLPSTSCQSLTICSNVIIDRSPQLPILQNFRRGYNGLGGHTSFTQSLMSLGKKPMRPLNVPQKNLIATKNSSTFFL